MPAVCLNECVCDVHVDIHCLVTVLGCTALCEAASIYGKLAHIDIRLGLSATQTTRCYASKWQQPSPSSTANPNEAEVGLMLVSCVCVGGGGGTAQRTPTE